MTLKVVSYNLRYASADDGHPWSARRQPMIDLITALAPDVLGTQEGLAFALADLAEGLPGRYGWVGRGRGVGWDESEFSAVFYDTTRFDVDRVRHRWLSDTPEVPASITWGSTLPRMYTHVTLVERATGRPLEVVNTHLDHERSDARLRSIQQLRAVAEPWAAAGRSVLLTGDFNAPAGPDPERFGHREGWSTQSGAEYASMTGSGLIDAVAAAAEPGPEICSCPGYLPPEPGGPRIDWIFCSADLRPQTSRVVDLAPGGVYPSDHLPVEVTFEP